MTRANRVLRVLAVSTMLLGTIACEDLNVPNENEPDRARSLALPTDIEALVGGTFLLWWQVNHGLGTAAETRPSAAVGALAAIADEVTASGAHYGIQDIGRRPIAPLINDPGSSWHPYVEGTWQEYYKVLSATREALIALKDPSFKLGANGVDNKRLETFAKFMQGMATAGLGYIYKEAYVLDETVTDDQLAGLKIKPYAEVMAAGIKDLDAAITLAKANTFTLPSTWMTVAWTNQDLAKIASSYKARYMAGVGRNPTERKATDWAAVLAAANAGIAAKDFGVETDGPGGKWKAQIIQAFGASYTSGGSRKIHNDIVGPADTSGVWQTWHNASYLQRNAITITTPDRRIHGAGGNRTIGTLVQWWSTSGMAESRGLYYFSLYADTKWRDYRTTSYGYIVDFPLKELEYLKAEAYIRLNQTQAAVDIINKSRAGGQLPAITASGASGPACVPRNPQKQCGTLMEALMYEKGLELWLNGMGVRFTDMRGWGQLEEFMPLHLPVPKNELTLAGLPFYTTGGPGGVDAAPKPVATP